MLTEQEREVRDRVRRWCDTEVIPVMNRHWEAAEVPMDLLLSGYAGLGVAGGAVRGFGCPGHSHLLEGKIIAELARADGSLSTVSAVHSGLAMATIGLLGDEEQKQRWLPSMAGLDKLGAFALTEPQHGSDVVQLQTSAVRDGQEWVLTGQKRWIGLGGLADLVIVWARDEDGNVGGFVVEQPGRGEFVPGYRARTLTGKIANRAVWQAHIDMDGVRIPAGNRLAGANTFTDTNLVLAKSRLGVAWEGVGHAVGAYEGALAYALRREQFGRPIAKFQLVQDKLSHMLAQITAMQGMCTRTAQLLEQGRMGLEHAAMCKMTAAGGARQVCAMAREILGGNGILLDHHVARHYADIEAVFTYEGTESVQSLIVGRAVTGLSAFV
ncbi:MAG: acyl-CoA dehydrogenase [Micrococcales bacterium]|nr:MAG: acyl-CoA dehydrogenase [Micrococcales bacterium]